MRHIQFSLQILKCAQQIQSLYNFTIEYELKNIDIHNTIYLFVYLLIFYEYYVLLILSIITSKLNS